MIPYSHQSVDGKDARAVADAVQSDWLTTGPRVKEFEEAFCRFIGARYAVAVSSGTAALHLAYLALGLSQGDEVITTPMTFAATANAALYCTAKPVFADIGSDDSGLIDPVAVERLITTKTKVLAPVHYAGQPCDMARISALAKKRGLSVVDDACHALGATYRTTKIGDTSFADMTCFSFHPVKHITTGEGGMVTTNRKDLYDRLLMQRNHGLGWQQLPDAPWLRPIELLGYNYRITDFQCALGASQLQRFPAMQKKRMQLVKRYDGIFARLRHLIPLKQLADRTNAYHLYVVMAKDAKTRLRLYNHLLANGIKCQVHYLPVYRHPLFQGIGFEKGLCPNAERFYEKILSLPLYPDLTLAQQDSVVAQIKKFFA